MLNLLQDKQDVLNLMYALGEGRGLPRNATKHLEPFVTFAQQTEPSGHETFEMRHAETGALLKREVTELFNYTMPLICGYYEPGLDDFELSFELPAVCLAHFEEGFDRMGAVTIAFIDIVPMTRLERARRYSAHERMASVLCHVDAARLGVTPEALESRFDWYNQASETDVRLALTEHYGEDFSTDEALHPWLSHYWHEFDFYFVFLQGGTYADLLRRTAEKDARRAAKKHAASTDLDEEAEDD